MGQVATVRKAETHDTVLWLEDGREGGEAGCLT